MKANISERFDYVFSSGMFNLCTGSNNAFMKEALERMWELCTAGMAFNFYSDTTRVKDSSIFYFSKSMVERFCRRLPGAEYHSKEEKSILLGNHVTAYVVKTA
ncbi:MAG: hypothetical protein R6U32_07365 [Candidatus Woesearchaeota archaeon]